MKVAEAAEKLGGEILVGADEAGTREIGGGYVSDMLSDVMGNCQEGDLWVTMQRHANVVAVAQLHGLAGVVLVNGRQPEAEMAKRAAEEAMKDKAASIDYAQAQAELAQAVAQLAAIQKLRKRT